jgi:hypothetical protein
MRAIWQTHVILCGRSRTALALVCFYNLIAHIGSLPIKLIRAAKSWSNNTPSPLSILLTLARRHGSASTLLAAIVSLRCHATAALRVLGNCENKLDSGMGAGARLGSAERKTGSEDAAADCEPLHAVVAHVAAVAPLVEACNRHKAELHRVDLRKGGLLQSSRVMRPCWTCPR